MTPGWNYAHVHDYLEWSKPRLSAIRDGADSPDAREWHRKWMKALHARINLKALLPVEVNYPMFVATYHVRPDGKVFSWGGDRGREEGRRIGWRKLDQDWQRHAMQDASDARRSVTERVRVYGFRNKDYAQRLAHLVSEREAA